MLATLPWIIEFRGHERVGGIRVASSDKNSAIWKQSCRMLHTSIDHRIHDGPVLSRGVIEFGSVGGDATTGASSGENLTIVEERSRMIITSIVHITR